MRLAGVELLRVRLPLKRAFTTSFGTSAEKECVLVRALGPDDAEGWGECTAMEAPRYSGEWNDGAWLVLKLVVVTLAVLMHLYFGLLLYELGQRRDRHGPTFHRVIGWLPLVLLLAIAALTAAKPDTVGTLPPPPAAGRP
jgi:L-alanine-DL-glutamate epimerase-like enolase superfamily enzyme